MSEWSNVIFRDIAEFNPRESIKKGEIATKIGMDKLQPFCRDISEIEHEIFSGGTKFRNGDTIMARITPCLENGKTAMVNILNDDEVGFGSTEYIVLRAKKGIADPHFLYYLVCSPTVRELAIKSMVGSSGRQRVQTDVVQNMELLVPCFEKQIIIGDFLKKIDDKIAVNNKINRNLEDQAFALFESYFPNAMYGEKKIGDYVTPSRGKNLVIKDAVPGDIPVVAGGLSPSTYHNEANTIGPVLTISASGANAGYVALWNQSVWSSDSSYIDSSMTEDVYFWYVMLKKRQKEIFDSQTGSAQPHIYPKHIEVMPVIDLDKDIIKDFTNEVTPMFILIGSNGKENESLITLRDSLLPKLMSGELDVSDLEI